MIVGKTEYSDMINRPGRLRPCKNGQLQGILINFLRSVSKYEECNKRYADDSLDHRHSTVGGAQVYSLKSWMSILWIR